MKADFLGVYSKHAIKNKLDKVLLTYHMEASEEKYKKVGLMLHKHSKASKLDTPEMELADCLISAYTPKKENKLDDTLVLCAMLMEEQNK